MTRNQAITEAYRIAKKTQTEAYVCHIYKTGWKAVYKSDIGTHFDQSEIVYTCTPEGDFFSE